MRMEGLRDRVKQFALRVIRMYSSLPTDIAAQVMGKASLAIWDERGCQFPRSIEGPIKRRIHFKAGNR